MIVVTFKRSVKIGYQRTSKVQMLRIWGLFVGWFMRKEDHEKIGKVSSDFTILDHFIEC